MQTKIVSSNKVADNDLPSHTLPSLLSPDADISEGHYLRTSLTEIKWFTELMLKDGSKLTLSQQLCLTQIEEGVSRLTEALRWYLSEAGVPSTMTAEQA